MTSLADRILNSIEVLQPTLPLVLYAPDATLEELKEATPQSRVAAVKVLVGSISQLSSLQHEDFGKLLSLTFENLLASCGDKDADVRVAADEGLNHLINELHGIDSAKIQIELFKEIKRNSSPRCVRAAIIRFAELAYLIKPQKCRAYVMNLLPLLRAVCNREDEAIQESLILAMPKIVTVLGPFFSESELHSFLSDLFNILTSKLSSSRRMAAECITSLCHSCLKPGIFYSISLEKMLLLTINKDASAQTLIGGFLGLRKILVSVCELPRKEEDQYFFNLDHISITFAVIFRSLSHPDHNVQTAALSTLQTLIEQNGKQLSGVLLGDVGTWNSRFEGRQLGDFMIGTKHSNKNMLLSTEIEDGTFVTKMEDLFRNLFQGQRSLLIEAAVFLTSTFLVQDAEVVKGVRVSVKSLAINCLTEFTTLHPQLLSDNLGHLPAAFRSGCDPMLQGNIMALCGNYIRHYLQQSYYLSWTPECGTYIRFFIEGIKDESVKVHKAVCDAVRICLPALMKVNQCELVIDLLEALLPLHLSSYWLVKTALLEVIKEVNFSYLCCFSDRAAYLQKETVSSLFVILSDEDVRVQSACAQCFTSIVDKLNFSSSSTGSLMKILRNESIFCNEFVNPPVYAICLPSDSSQHVESKTTQSVGSLSRLINILLEQMLSSDSTEMVRGCIDTFASLSRSFVNCEMLKYWGVSIPGEQQKISSHHLQEGAVLSSSSGLISYFTQHLTSSMYMYDIQCHQNLLVTITALLGSTCKHLISNNSYSADLILSWSLLNDDTLVEIVQSLVYHIMRVLNICCYVCGEEEPPTDSNFKEKVSAVANKRKKKEDDDEHAIELDGSSKVGSFTFLPHYMKFYENLKASYEAHKVSLDLQSDEKFVLVLRGTLRLFQEVLKYSSLKNVGSFSEEVNEYLTKLIKKEPIQCITTTRYLLASIFGTNVICTNLNRLNKSGQMNLKKPLPLVVSKPVHIEFFKYSPYIYTTRSPIMEAEEVEEEPEEGTSFAAKIFGKRFQKNQKKKVEKKPDPKPIMQNYIRYFEATVMKALELYTTLTNSTQVQGEILVLLIDLLRLRVNYSLLDTGKVFVNFLLKQFEYIEQGQVREASKLLPTLFQFLIMLTKEKYQEEAVIDIPRIMQLCGTAMASGQLNTASISVSLYPLIHELFVTQESNNVTDIITQREVVESILLKNVIHYQVIDILWIVLHWYTVDVRNFSRYSASVWSAVSIAISQARLDVSSHKVIVSMSRLLDIISNDTTPIIETLLDFTDSASTQLSRCSYICLALRHILVVASKGNLDKVIGECSESLAACCGDKHSGVSGVSGAMGFGNYLIWALEQNIAYLLEAEGTPFASFSSLNYIHRLVYYVKDDPQFTPRDLDITGIRDQVARLSAKYPAACITVVQLCNLFCSEGDPRVTFGGTLVGKFLALADPQKDCTSSPKSTLVQLTQIKECSLTEFSKRMSEILGKGGHGYSILSFAASLTGQYLANITANLGEFKPDDVIDSLKVLEEVFGTHKLSGDVISKIKECRELLKVEHDADCVPDATPRLTVEGLQERFGSTLCSYPSDPLAVVPVLRDMPLHQLKVILSKSSFDTGLFYGIITLGRRELCAQKSVYIHPDEPLPPLPSTILASKTQLLDRISILTGVKSGTSQSARVAHTHKKSNSTSLPKSVALFVDTSGFSDLQKLLQPSTTWAGPGWRRDLWNYTRAITALLDTAILYPDVAYLDPYQIHAVTRLMALSMAVNHHFDCYSDASTCFEILKLLLAVIITRDTCAVLHYGEEMDIVKHVYHILVSLFGKTMTKTHTYPETIIDKVRLMVNFVLYKMPKETHHSISDLNVVRKCILSLASLPGVSSYLRIPKLLALTSSAPEENTEFNLASIELDFLKDSEVLEDFLYRNLSFGWSTKRQFEELWVTMLGMITYRFEPEMSREEMNELSVVNRLAVRGMTALLMQTMLHPVPGSPKTSIYQHFPRTQQVPFLTTTIGQKMIYPHKLVFDKMLCCSRLTPSYQPFYPDLNAFIDSEFSYQLIDTGALAQSIDKTGVFIHDLNRVPGSSSYCHGYYSATALRERIITNDVTNLDNEGIIERSVQVLDDTSDDNPDILSCLHFLVDLFAEWTLPESCVPVTLLNQIINSVSQLSDMFQKTHHCQWMVDSLLQILINHPLEDSIIHSKLLLTLSKAISLLQADKAGEKLLPFVEEALASDSIILQLAALHGSFYLLESQLACFENNLVNSLAEFVINKLEYDTCLPVNYLATTWAIATIIKEKFPEESENCPGFTMTLMQFGMKCMAEQATPFILYQFVVRGFQRLVLAFSLPSSEFDVLIHLSTNQLEVDDPQKCLSAFGLLMTCMYCGREGSRVLQLERDQETTDQMLATAMDKMRKILDCVGHCCDSQAKPLAAVICYLVNDFLPKEQMINTFVSEFLSPRQQNRHLIALVLFDLFQSIIHFGNFSQICEWVLLVLRNFVQLKPLGFSMWSTSILLLCSSKNRNLARYLPFIISKVNTIELDLFTLICQDFAGCLSQDELLMFIEMFRIGSDVHSKDCQDNGFKVIVDLLEK